MRVLAAILVWVLALSALAIGTVAGPYHIDILTDPAVVPVGKATLLITVTDSAGNPVTGAQIHGIAQMPGMPMGERDQQAVPGQKPGEYRLTANFAMAGGYEAKISVAGPRGTAMATIPMETGMSTVSGASDNAGVPWSPLVLGVVLVVVLVITIRQMRRTHQRLNGKDLLSPGVVIAVFVFLAVLLGAVYAVNHFRRPGAMTPVQAQVMDMDSPPPEGVAPVTLAPAESGPFSPTVRYTGQVVGFVEQDVFPRVTGTLVWMPLYVGSVVHKGQIVAKLDTSQLVPQTNEKAAQVQSARSAVASARADYDQALAAVGEAEAELGQREGLVHEAEANLLAARDANEAAKSEVVSARSDAANARAALSSAIADQKYWIQEIGRERSLLDAGAVSKDEYQKEQAEADKSAASVREAQQAVLGSQAKVRTSQAQERQSQAGIAAAQNKVNEARSELMAHHAHVRTSHAAADSAKQRISAAEAGVGAAEAVLQGVTANAGYAEIRSETDGVVTQRLISPGVLVNPGQSILKIAQIQPVRVQANVAESDLSKIRVGFEARVSHRDIGEAPVSVRVSSVSPSVDPMSRTGTVEVLLPNTSQAYLPGQFASMEIATSASKTALTIPAKALQTQVAASSVDVTSTAEQHFVWVATQIEGQPGRFTVARVPVQIGDSEGDVVAILSGLRAGDQVVTEGAEGLQAGQTVSASSGQPGVSTKQSDSPQATVATSTTVEIGEHGFDPANVTLTAGQPLKLTFLRKTDNTCATEVVFGSLHLRKALPLNVPVTIELPPQTKGEVSYACGMNMYKGSVVVR